MALLDDLEDFVDGHGLHKVIATLCEICYEKADHVATNWQDEALASLWEEAGGVLDTAANEVPELPGSFAGIVASCSVDLSTVASCALLGALLKALSVSKRIRISISISRQGSGDRLPAGDMSDCAYMKINPVRELHLVDAVTAASVYGGLRTGFCVQLLDLTKIILLLITSAQTDPELELGLEELPARAIALEDPDLEEVPPYLDRAASFVRDSGFTCTLGNKFARGVLVGS